MGGGYKETTIEGPVFIGMSQIETGKIGAFTMINRRTVKSQTNNCVIECQSIGRFVMIAHAVNIGFAGHPTKFLSNHLVFRYDNKTSWAHDFITIDDTEVTQKVRLSYFESSKKPMPIIGNDVWIGYGATILNGAKIGDGAIIAAGSVVTKDVEPYSIVGGNPAKLIKKRFDQKTIDELLGLKWWDYGPDILENLRIDDISLSLPLLKERIVSGKYEKFIPPLVIYDNENNTYSLKEFDKKL